MSWVTIIWSMVASACLTLGAVHLLVWCQRRTAWANLLFSVSALATVALAGCEFWMMRAGTPAQFAIALRWVHVPTWVIIMALMGFVLVHLRAGRRWLAWTVVALRTFSLLLNFLVGQNINYLEVTRLRSVPFLGESVSIAEGLPNPWMLVAQSGLVFLLVFLVDATITVWRRGDRRQALVVGGSILFFVLFGSVQAILVLWQVVASPVTLSLFYLGIVAAMGYELTRETIRAAQLSDDLRESEERMTLAAKATGVGVWMWNIPGNEVWGSERWLVLFGFTPGTTVTFEKVIQRIHPDDRELVESGVRRALADRSDYLGDYRVVLPDGTRRWIVARGRMYQDSHGKPVRMLGTAIDITYRKQTELALAESELHYRTLFETAPEGIALIGLDGHVRAANTAQARLYGYESPQQLVGLYAPLCVAEKDRERAARNMKDLLNGEERPVRCYTAVRCDGSEFIVEVTSAILRGLGREIQGYLCLTRDITESKRTELALQESVERFRQVAEIAGEFIWEVDAQGLYTYASPSVGKILGYTPEELVGKKHFYDLFDPSVHEELKAAVFSTFAKRQEFRDFPNPNVSKSGKIVHLETSGVPMLDPAGNLAGYRGADADVTERKNAEAELLRERAELAHVARVSTMGELAASVAHELNQPLGAILANADAAELFLQEDPPAIDELRAILVDIRKDDERAGEVIRRMRALLRKHELERQPLEINSLVEDVLQFVSGDAALRGISLTADLGPVLPKVSGDRIHLQQVLLNLILNGMDAMAGQPREQRRILVRTRLGADGRVELAVVDSGHGIEPDKLPRLFEPFYTTKPNGMGMGLSIARTIIEVHHGRIWAENHASGGAVFRIALPVNGDGQKAEGR